MKRNASKARSSNPLRNIVRRVASALAFLSFSHLCQPLVRLFNAAHLSPVLSFSGMLMDCLSNFAMLSRFSDGREIAQSEETRTLLYLFTSRNVPHLSTEGPKTAEYGQVE